MGARGPKQQSPELNERKGNPGKRQPTTTQVMPLPTALAKLPTPPKHLLPIAKSEWRRAGKELVATGRLTTDNLRILEQYCTAYATFRDAHAKMDIEGQYIKTKFTTRPHPAHGIAFRASKEMRDALTLLHGTESEAEKRAPEDPLFDFLNRGKKLRNIRRVK
ncbi:hypothetical protein DSCW_07630 [Desulfosarcina widdelii]|uniref:Terminase n=1 Tax=Desulfosarcina widdelii TaxID=947919 RepID=A0A5K7YVK5_9BACT|nr:P27 family phage terminase small subunit [Desulfosarcina widdelii]BBO73346.1 hypothetical protein DSCW_07630 [Desulfosarcina widdelii]